MNQIFLCYIIIGAAYFTTFVTPSRLKGMSEKLKKEFYMLPDSLTFILRIIGVCIVLIAVMLLWPVSLTVKVIRWMMRTKGV